MNNTDHLERFGDEGIGDGWGAGGDRQNGDDDYNDTKKREKRKRKKEKIGDGWGAGGDRQNVPRHKSAYGATEMTCRTGGVPKRNIGPI